MFPAGSAPDCRALSGILLSNAPRDKRINQVATRLTGIATRTRFLPRVSRAPKWVVSESVFLPPSKDFKPISSKVQKTNRLLLCSKRVTCWNSSPRHRARRGRLREMTALHKEFAARASSFGLCGDQLDGLSSERALRTGGEAATAPSDK